MHHFSELYIRLRLASPLPLINFYGQYRKAWPWVEKMYQDIVSNSVPFFNRISAHRLMKETSTRVTMSFEIELRCS